MISVAPLAWVVSQVVSFISSEVLKIQSGMWYSPRKERLFGGVMLLKKRAPVLGGSFALWGGLFSMTDCLLIYFRQKEDYINPVIAGFVTGGILAIRAGTRIAFRNAVFGGLILGCIQMVEIVMLKWQARAAITQSVQMQEDEYMKQTEMILDMQKGIISYSEAKKKKGKIDQKEMSGLVFEDSGSAKIAN